MLMIRCMIISLTGQQLIHTGGKTLQNAEKEWKTKQNKNKEPSTTNLKVTNMIGINPNISTITMNYKKKNINLYFYNWRL